MMKRGRLLKIAMCLFALVLTGSIVPFLKIWLPLCFYKETHAHMHAHTRPYIRPNTRLVTGDAGSIAILHPIQISFLLHMPNPIPSTLLSMSGRLGCFFFVVAGAIM